MLTGDAAKTLRTLDDESVHCCVTSPPYWGLRNYGVDGQLGLERTPEEYVGKLVDIFREVRRVLRDDGTLWLNLGDSYAASGQAGGAGKQHTNVGSVNVPVRQVPNGLKPKDLVGIPWRVAFALQADGWYLRSDIVWAKTNPMPESVTDRPTKSHEYLFLMAKSERYFYEADAIAEPVTRNFWNESVGPEYMTARDGRNDGGKRKGSGPMDGKRNKRSVWTVSTQPYADAHFATFPFKLIEPCILAGCPVGGTVLDPFAGAGTTCIVSLRNRRNFIGIELNPEYTEMATKRIEDDAPLFNTPQKG